MNAQKFEGLLLTLKKRKLNITKEDVSDEKKDNVKNYLVLGHFDEMDIKHIEKWSDWSPRNTDAISLRDEFVDKYVIKVYFPEYSQREKLQQKGFDYGIWNKQDVEEAPFTVVSVINISEKYVEIVQKENKDMKEVLYEQVEHCASSNVFKDIWRDLHCAVCPTIGFSDFVLMFKTPKLKKALEFIDVLKQIICEGTVFLSNVYTMTGFCKNGLDKLQNSDVDGLRFSIRFGLRNGISAATFQKYFEDKIDDYKNQKKLFDGEDETYDVLGGSDSVIVSNLKLKTFLPLYFCDNDVPNIFHPKHEMFTNYIRSMHSEISVNIPKDAPKTEIVSNSSSVEKYKDTYNEYREELKGFVQDQNMPERIVYGIQIVMKRFLELIQSGHCFDVEKIIGDAFLSLEKCTEQNIKDLRNAGSQEDVQQLFDALNCFREIIGNYLADMQRSDSLSLEGRSLSHPSIGSATKLLLFYNGYINTLKEILCGEKGNNFCFVVTSGGTDRTKVIDVFSHLTPTIEDVNSLLIVTMPELSLYTIRESLFHIFHEVLHFCGERKRKDRAKYVIEAVSGYTACWLCDFFKNHQKERYDSSEVTAVFLDKKENCMKKIDEIIDQCSVTLQLN